MNFRLNNDDCQLDAGRPSARNFPGCQERKYIVRKPGTIFHSLEFSKIRKPLWILLRISAVTVSIKRAQIPSEVLFYDDKYKIL